MGPLHRHQLAWLSEPAWRRLQEGDWDKGARDCLAHWAARRLPLVVTRQPAPACADTVALGLPAPGRWERRRLALGVLRSEVQRFDEFPRAEQLAGLLPVSARPSWHRLCAELKAAHVSPRVYGSYGWQWLSGLDHIRAGSDIDVWLSVSDPSQADAAAACLQSASGALPRLDGELMFDDGSAVAWREWLAWRGARVKSLLVKTVAGSSLVHSAGWQGAAAWAEPA